MSEQSSGDTEQSGLSEDAEERWRELHEKPLDELSDAEVTSKVSLSVRRRFDYPEWVLMFEYGAPGSDGRVCDCLAVNTLPSRNYKVVGMEFKASRSDWLREKRDGQKADYFVQMADEYYLVAPKGVAEESEIPDGWGYLELKPNSEQLYKLQDSELTDHQQGDPDRRFWVRFLKQTVGADSNYSAADLDEARSRGYQEAVDEGVQRKADLDLDRLKRKAEKWEALEDAGLRFIADYDDVQVDRLQRAFAVVRTLREDSHRTLRGDVTRVQESVQRRFEDVASELADLESELDELAEAVEGAEGSLTDSAAETTLADGDRDD